MFGASGKTKEEMLRGLKYPESYTDNAVANNFQAFTEAVRGTNGLNIGKFHEVWA
jgi:hypothetical protein